MPRKKKFKGETGFITKRVPLNKKTEISEKFDEVLKPYEDSSNQTQNK